MVNIEKGGERTPELEEKGPFGRIVGLLREGFQGAYKAVLGNSDKTKENLIASLEEIMAYVEKNPAGKEHSLEELRHAMQEAKKVGVDVSRYEAEIPRLTEKVFRARIEHIITNLETTPEKEYFSLINLINTMQEAEKAGVDVSEYEAQILELKKKVFIAYVEHIKNDTHKKHNYPNVLAKLKHLMQEAEKAGVDVSEYEAMMPELTQKALRAHAEKIITDLEKLYRPLGGEEEALKKAKESGAPVDDLEERMLKLDQAFFVKKADEMLNALEEWVDGPREKIIPENKISVEIAIKNAKTLGGDTAQLEKRFEIYKRKFPKLA